MKILIISSGSFGTGSFVQAEGLLQEFIKLGHKAKLLFPLHKNNFQIGRKYITQPDQFEIWKFPIQKEDHLLESFPLLLPYPHPYHNKGKLLSQLTTEEFKLYIEALEVKLLKVIDTYKPDVIECLHIWIPAFILNKLGYQYFCGAQLVDQLTFNREIKFQKYLLAAAQNASNIFAISDLVKDEVISNYKINKNKVIIIPNGYNRELFKKTNVNKANLLNKLQLNIPLNANIFCFPGSISTLKGFDILLKANNLIPEEENIHFVIIGAGTFDETFFSEKLIHLHRIHHLGFQDQEVLNQIYNISKYCVLPARSEGFGIVFLEAMACGLPVITTDVVGCKDAIIGRTIPVENPTALADAILEFNHLSCKVYEKLSRKAILVAEQFSWKKSALKRLPYYESVHEKHK